MGAQVYLDGERVGTSPVQLTIPTGAAHIVTVKKDGFRIVQQAIAADSEQTRFNFQLKSTN